VTTYIFYIIIIITQKGGVIIKNFFDDEKSLNVVKYMLLVIFASVVFYRMLDHLDLFFKGAWSAISFLVGLLLPFIYGFSIAYLANPLVVAAENKIYGKIIKHHMKLKRVFSVITVYLIVFLTFVGLIVNILPQVQDILTEKKLLSEESLYGVGEFAVTYDIISAEKMDSLNQSVNSLITSNLSPILDNSDSALKFLLGLFTYIFKLASGFLKFIIGIVISIYILIDKEKTLKNMKKVIFAFAGRDNAKKIIWAAMDFHKIFSKFFVGKAIDSLVIGLICYIGLTLLQIPFALLLSAIVAITNMIPYFGPLIGAVPVVLITFATTSWISTVWVGLFMLALQQFDGIILGPKILGESTGLSPFWVIFSIMLGGGLFGFIGMFLAVPVFVVIHFIAVTFINKKWSQKYNSKNSKY